MTPDADVATRVRLRLGDLGIPIPVTVLSLAPHPDDFDAIAVTLRSLRELGATIRVAVVSSGASGVDDADCRPPTPAAKAALREQEQKESCREFGLSDSALEFLRLPEDPDGHPLDDPAAHARIREVLARLRPGMVCLPHRNDTNAGHRRVAAMLSHAIAAWPEPLVVLWNRDPKTLEFTPDLVSPYDNTLAQWKRRLLRCHRSQDLRNRRHRGPGFDDRILDMDRENARRYAPEDGPYAEAFALDVLVAG